VLINWSSHFLGPEIERGVVMSYEMIIEKVFTVLISAALGWLISAATKVSNTRLEKVITELEQRVISPILKRVERLEAKSEGFATRSDVKEIVMDLRSAMEARQVEIRGTMSEIYKELREMAEERGQRSLKAEVRGQRSEVSEEKVVSG
jgi:RNA-binding protein YhbY